jgi:uncharacterized protein (TIGR02453 family)
MAGFSTKTFAFIQKLERHNSKAWFERNRDEYDAVVKAPCNEFIAELRRKIGPLATHYRFPAQGFGRLYRDPRRAAEKGPFKNWTGAAMAPPSVSRFEQPPGLWFQIGTGRENIFSAAGWYQPSAHQLRLIRNFIDSPSGGARFVKLAQSSRIRKHFGGIEGESLKTFPRGYDKNHPHMKWLKRTQFYLWRPYSRLEACRPDFSDRVADDLRVGLEFNWLLEEILGAKPERSVSRRFEEIPEAPTHAFDF